jgi:hypothetical protein
MSTYIISILVLLLVSFGVYKLFKRRSKNIKIQQSLSEDDLKPFLADINLQTEEGIRRQWLVSFYVYMGGTALFTFFNFFKIDSYNQLSELIGVIFTILLGLFILFPVLTPWFWITYHCAYKKRGTAWLMLFLISLPLGELANVAQGEWNQAMESGSFALIILMTFVGSEVFFWINCLRLYKFNSKRKYQTVLALKAKYGPEANGFCT